MLATGRAELMVDPIMESWDAGPVAPDCSGGGGNVYRLGRDTVDPFRERIRHEWAHFPSSLEILRQ